MKKNYLLLILFGFLSLFVKAQAPGNIGVTTTSAPDICNPGESATLSCNYFQIFQQTGYTVGPIAYNPPFGATNGSATNLTIDDRFSSVIDLKGLTPQDFNFCFYGNNYTKGLISTNGAITFSISGEVPGGLYSPATFSTWVMTAVLPYAGSTGGGIAPLKAAIHGVFQDTDPRSFSAAPNPNINYYTTGTYPNRAFVVNFSGLSMYNCTSNTAVGEQTSQIVLYEGTNIIDIYVARRRPCNSWNSGNGLIGIQNAAGTVASFPAGRNLGAWSADNEAWRFTPNGVMMNPTLQWTDNLGNVVGNTQTITVSPNATTTYTVTATYPSCIPSVNYQVTDQTTVNLIDIPAGTPSHLYNCDTGAASYSWDFTPNGTAVMAALNPANYVLSYHTSLASAQGTDANLITGSTTNYTTPGGTVTIWVAVEDLNTGCRDVQSFNLIVRNCTATPVQPPNLVACDADGNGTESFNLTSQNTTILGGQNAADYTITYHTTLASADGTTLNSALIPAGAAVGQNQNFVSAGQIIYVRMESVATPGVFGNTTFQLIVNPRPAITGTLSTCIGSTTQLTGAGTPASSNAWTSSDTSVATVNSSGLITGVASGTAIITYTDNNGCSNTTTVTINALPTVTVNSPTTCQGGTVTLTATPGTPGTYNYVWTVPSGATNPGNVTSFTTSIGGAYGVVITDTTTNCSSLTGAGTVTVNPLPTVTVNSPSVCSGNSATVTATPGDASAYSFVWTVPGGFPNPGNVASFATTIPGTYSVIITNTVTTCSSTSASGTVSFNPLPTVTVNSPVVCAGTSATVTATPGAAGSYSYVWTVPGGATNPGNVASFTTTVAGAYSVVITNTVTTCSSASASGTVTLNPLPTVTVSNSSICSGDIATVTATPGAAGTYTYVWTVPGSVTNPGNVASFTTTTAGTYSVIITDTTTNCSSVSASGTVTASPAGGSMNLQCGPYNSAGHPGEIYIDWSNVPGITTFNYSYSINGGPVVNGSQNSPSSIYILTSGQPITFTLSGVGTVCVPTETITCGCPSPIINAVPNVLSCSGQVVNQINFATSDPYDTVSWTNSNTAIGLAASGTTNFIPSFTAATVTAPQTATITVVLTKFGCAGPPRTFTITINPLPSVTVNSPVTCAGTNTNVTATPDATGTYSYAWTVPGGFPNPGNVVSFATSAAGTYSVVITNTTTGCVSASASGTVTVNPLPTVTVNSATVCTGASATITATSGSAGTYSYAWTVPSGATNPGNVASFSTTTVGTYSVIITNTTTNCSSASASGTVSNNPIPTVTVNSPSVCSGALATVTATPGSAGAYSYAWTVPAGVANPGSVASFTTSIAGNYSVIITNTVTTCTSASASGTVTVNPLPTVTVNSPVTCAGINTTVTATPGAAGTYSYAWTVPAGFPNPGNVASFATSTAGTYSVVITNTATSCVSVSASGTVTVNPLPTVTVNSTTVCAGASAALTATPGSVATYSYAWTVPTGAANPGNVASFSTATAGTYSVIITDTATNCSSASASGTVTNNPLPTATVNNPSICSGASATVVATPGSAGTYSYAWTVPAGVTDPGDVASFVTSTPGAYSVVITNTVTNCSSAIATGNVTLNPTPTVTATSASPTLCSGQSTGIQLQSNVANATFTWTFTQTGGVTGASNGSGNIISQVLTAGTVPGTVTYTVTPTAAGSCTGIPITVTVSVTPVPVLNLNTTSQSICTGQSTNIVMTSNIATTTFSWNVLQSGGLTGGTTGTGNVINDVLTTSGNTITQAVYTIIPYNNGCPGTPKTVTVTVYPTPNVTASPVSDTVCSGDTTNIVLNSNVPGTVFNWTVLQTGVFGAASGSGSTISQTLTTVGLTPGSVTYTITPSVNGCTGTPITVTVTVNPTPEVFSSANAQVICSGESAGITVIPNISGTSISWTSVSVGVTGATNGNGSETTPGAGITIGDTLVTTGTAQGTVTYTITPINNGCSGTPITVVVKVNPLPSITIPDGVICVDAVTGALIYGYTMDTGLSETAYDFQWYFGSDLTTVVGTGSSYVAEEAGLYTLSIMNAVTGCTEVFMINVTASNPAQSATAVVTNYFQDSQAITVTVVGNGSYLYSLDGGAFQTSNVFPHVLPGLHTVTIHDTIGCTDITLENILTIGYPHFFTPNGDGYNDTWNIWSLSDDQPNSEIHIYDRYGKLIKQIIPAGTGWDGTFNGQFLPSTDYWFTVKYMENGAEKEFKAHFSMKR